MNTVFKNILHIVGLAILTDGVYHAQYIMQDSHYLAVLLFWSVMGGFAIGGQFKNDISDSVSGIIALIPIILAILHSSWYFILVSIATFWSFRSTE